MPRYEPPTALAEPSEEVEARAKEVEREQVAREAAASRARLLERDAERVERVALRVRARPVYGRDSEHSYFRDRALTASRVPNPLAAERLNLHRAHEERERRGPLGAETRAITSSALGGVVALEPLWVLGTLMAAVRSAAPLYDALLKLPLPDQGTTIQFSKFTTGATTAVQNPENWAVSITDAVVAFDNEPLSTIAGAVEYSFQLYRTRRKRG